MPFLPRFLVAAALVTAIAAPAAWAAVYPLDRSWAHDAGIAGAVFDVAGRPVAGARVSIVGTAASTATDRDGKFRFDDAQGTEVVLSVVAIGYRPLNQRVRVGDTAIRIVVTPMVVNL
ncbi:MAG: carboxypeptidase-like regulatory domain-containing protein, partial [Gemmatimonadetes bacterium]|nr:carboxypeptidase-like regulatory domain-containing protein [Gemmatimonadota bacterium]